MFTCYIIILTETISTQIGDIEKAVIGKKSGPKLCQEYVDNLVNALKIKDVFTKNARFGCSFDGVIYFEFQSVVQDDELNNATESAVGV